MEMQVGYQHLLLEISKELLVAESVEILDTISQSLCDVGQVLIANRIVIQLFNDLDDMNDDKVISWSVSGDQTSAIYLNEDLFDFFISNQPYIAKGSVIKAFGIEPFEYDNLVYTMYVHDQPIGFLRIELMDVTHLSCLKKMVSHTVDLYTKAIERMNREVMVYDQMNVIHKTFQAIEYGVIEVSSGGRIELMNAYAERLFGVEESWCLGKSIDQIVMLDDANAHSSTFFGDLLQSDDKLPFSSKLTILLEDESITVRCKISPIYNDDYLYHGGVVVLEKL